MIKTLQCFPLSFTCTWSIGPYTICFLLTLTALSSVHLLSRVQLFATPGTAAHQASLSITNSQSLLKLVSMSRWCHPAISSSVVPFSSCLQSFPASGSFPTSRLFASGGQSVGASASASVTPVNTQGRSRWRRPASCPGAHRAPSPLGACALCSAASWALPPPGATALRWSWPSGLTLGVVLSDLLSETFPEHSKMLN